MTGNKLKRQEAEAAVFRILLGTIGYCLNYNDLVSAVNNECSRYISNKALSQMMKKHIENGWIINERKRVEGSRQQVWTLDSEVEWETFNLN